MAINEDKLNEFLGRFVTDLGATASAGSPAFSRARRRRAATARLEAAADEEPRRKAALPAFRHRPAASLVTLGRFS